MQFSLFFLAEYANAIALGLLAYALWKFALAAIGTGPEGGGGEGTGERLRNLAGGVAYLAFFAVAVGVLTGGGSNQSKQPSHTAAGVFGWPAGRWLVGPAGVVMIVVCAVQAYEALKGKFLGDNKTERMSAREREVFSVIGRIGLVSRALIFALVEYFLVRSAIDFNPRLDTAAFRSAGVCPRQALVRRSSVTPSPAAVGTEAGSGNNLTRWLSGCSSSRARAHSAVCHLRR